MAGGKKGHHSYFISDVPFSLFPFSLCPLFRHLLFPHRLTSASGGRRYTVRIEAVQKPVCLD